MDINTLLDPDIVARVQTGGYIMMFILMVIEWPLITIAAAFLASMGFFDIYVVALLGWLGDITGDMLFFSVGRFGLRIFRKKTTIDTPQEESFVYKLDKLIHTNLLLSLFLIKFTPYAPPIGLSYIGRSNISLKKYSVASFVSCFPIPVLAAFAGFHVGYLNTLLQKYAPEKIWVYLLLVLVIVVVSIIGVTYFKTQSKKIFGTHPHLNPSEDPKQK